MHNNCFLIADLDAVLGFINTSYEVNEADMNATIQIGLLKGFLRSKVLLELSVMNGTALSKFINIDIAIVCSYGL